MLEANLKDLNPTVRLFPRTLEEAFPQDYLSKGVIEGPYYAAEHSDLAVLLAIVAVVSMLVMVWRYM
jgi:hypothetical protein